MIAQEILATQPQLNVCMGYHACAWGVHIGRHAFIFSLTHGASCICVKYYTPGHSEA